MLDFLIQLEKALKLWPDNTKLSIIDLADQTGSDVPRVVQFLTDALGKTMDVHDPMTFNEISKAHSIMIEKNRPELEERKRREEAAMIKAIKSYDHTMEKVRIMQSGKNWRSAYKTLSYFYGVHEHQLPKELKVNVCDDCLRLGIKGNINFQELSQWLQRGIRVLMSGNGADVIEDALDFLDAYGDYFLADKKGEKFITNLFLALKPSCMEFDLTPKLNEVAGELKLTSVMDDIL